MEIESAPGYEPPRVASTHPVRSSHSGGVAIEAAHGVVTLGINLEARRQVWLSEYLQVCPKRKRESHWILEPGWAVAYRPFPSIPFFFNSSGRLICTLCDGERDLRGILAEAAACFPDQDARRVARGALGFLLLLEELDLIELREERA
ncbi:MAG: hypothetical protein QME94_15545 [Anaerolineae bacterium]|nr:hypothetical protein [Anaerolineae bacterium]